MQNYCTKIKHTSSLEAVLIKFYLLDPILVPRMASNLDLLQVHSSKAQNQKSKTKHEFFCPIKFHVYPSKKTWESPMFFYFQTPFEYE